VDYLLEENAGGTELRRFDYTFASGKPFVGSVTFSEASAPVMTQTYSHDSLGRLDGSSATLQGGASVFGVSYLFDNLDRRYKATLADSTWWDYGYNNRGEVTSSKRRLDASTFAGGKQFEYGFDDLGNRLVARFGGDASGANLSVSSYSPANALNQLTSRTVPGAIWLTGEAPDTLTLFGAAEGAAFTVTRQTGNRFFGEAVADNQSSARYARVTVAGKMGGTLTDVQTGNHFLPARTETFAYDFDGNLTSDGRWSYEWDAESRLKKMRSLAGSPAPERRIDFVYDWQGRRVRQTVWDDRDDGQGSETRGHAVCL
jgi:YD repeat-containing protein